MATIQPKLCLARHHSGALAEKLMQQFQQVLSSCKEERSVQHFLSCNPELIGWRFSWGTSPTIVRPEFRLGAEYVVDYLVIDSPQWTDVYLIELEPPTRRPFNKDGSYSKGLSQAIKQTGEWRRWVSDNKRYITRNLLEMIDKMDTEAFRKTVEPKPRSDYFPEPGANTYPAWLRRIFEVSEWRLKTGIVIGRRDFFGKKEEQSRRSFLDSTDQAALFSFDALLDTCRDRFIY